MAQATISMTKKAPQPICTYTSTKIDDEILPLAKAAAALNGINTQDFISDAVNAAASEVLNREPLTRRPLGPPKSAGRKPKKGK